jgi:hypothetical protein
MQGRRCETGSERSAEQTRDPCDYYLLQPEAFIDQPLKARAIENIVGEFFVWKHAESGAASICGHLRRLFQRQVGILADHRHHHAHHYLQAPQSAGLLHALVVFSTWLIGWLSFHTAPPFIIRWMLTASPALRPVAIVAASARESSCPWPYTFVTCTDTHKTDL